MSKIFKIASAGFGIIALIMMFLPQVVVNWSSDPSESLGISALTGGTFKYGVEYSGVGAGLAGYILIGIAALLVLACAFLNFFKEHDVLNYVALAAAIILALIAIILIFMIRKNFDSINGISNDFTTLSMGAGMIIAGVASILSLLSAGIALVIDIAK